MLVLTRRHGEQIEVRTPQGDIIDIVVVQLKGKQARIGVKCDRAFDVNRKEILNKDGGYLSKEQIKTNKKTKEKNVRETKLGKNRSMFSLYKNSVNKKEEKNKVDDNIGNRK